jgi:hypothetical protein
MAEGQDWDLYAIVRSCTSASTNRNGSSNTSENLENPFECLASLTFDDDDDQEFNPFSFPNLAVQPTNNDGLQELQDSYKPFLPSYTASGLQGNNDNIPSSSSISDFGVIFSGQHPPQLAHQQQQQQNHDHHHHHHHHHQHQQQQSPPPPSTSVSISPRFNNSQQLPQHILQQQQNQRRQLHQLVTSTSSMFPLRATQSQTPRSRKK